MNIKLASGYEANIIHFIVLQTGQNNYITLVIWRKENDLFTPIFCKSKSKTCKPVTSKLNPIF